MFHPKLIYRGMIMILAITLLGQITFGAEVDPFVKVLDGQIRVYQLSEMLIYGLGSEPPSTKERAQYAKTVSDLITTSVGKQSDWVSDGGHTAVLATSHNQIIVKAPEKYHQDIDDLLARLRESSKLKIRIEFQIVADDGAILPAQVAMGAVDEGKIAGVQPLLGPSVVRFTNGFPTLLVDGEGLQLPTLSVRGTVSLDRKSTVLVIGCGKAQIEKIYSNARVDNPIVVTMPTSTLFAVRVGGEGESKKVLLLRTSVWEAQLAPLQQKVARN